MTTADNGRFRVGNQAAVGHSSRSQRLRGAMLASVTEQDVQAIVAKLVDLARDGDTKAMALLFSIIGKPADGGVMQSAPAGDSDSGKAERIQQIAARIRLSRETESA